jgi:histone chaperone ASF1
MAFVNVTNVIVLDNPTAFTNNFQFEITFECLEELKEDLEWKVTYVGSAENESHDQVLEELLVGPVPKGMNRFVLVAPAPKHELIAANDLIGVTVVLVTCSFMEQEFVRIGYYVHNDYNPPVDPENPPATVDVTKLWRNILAEEPRVTRLPINWTGIETATMMNDPTAAEEAAAYDEAEQNMGSDIEEDEIDSEGDMDGDIDISGEMMPNEDSMDVERMQVQPMHV